MNGGFVLPVANETDDPITLDQTARFSVSVIDDEDDDVRSGDRHADDGDEWFGTASSEHDTAPVAAGLHFVAGDDGDGGVRFGAMASCDAPTAEGVSGDAADGAAVGTGPHADPTSASPSGARRCFALTFAPLAIRAAACLAAIGTFAAMDVLSGEIPVVASEHSQFAAHTAANRFLQEDHSAFAEGDFEAEYCIPDTMYDPPSMLPTSATGSGPFDTHLSTELGAHERTGFVALLEQHGGALAAAPGDLTRSRDRVPHPAPHWSGACQLSGVALLG